MNIEAAARELKNRLTACTWPNTIGPHNLDFATSAMIADWAADIFRKHLPAGASDVIEVLECTLRTEQMSESVRGAITGSVNVLKQASPAPAGPKWQPIETAPKDGTPIMVINNRGRFVVEWLKPTDNYRVFFDGWHVDDGDREVSFLRGSAPTHWCHLPSPPGGEA